MTVDTFPKHHPIAYYGVRGDCLEIGGRLLTEIVDEVGSVPCYLYDAGVIARKVDELRRTMPERLSLHYAIKANPFPDVVAAVAALVDGLDVASAGELEIALTTPIAPRDISFAGPGKKAAELERAVAAGITINAESATELERIARACERVGANADVALRVNPDFELRSSGMKMGGGAQQFGIDAERVPEALGRLRELGLRFRGFHVFSGSQNLRDEFVRDAHRKTFDLARRLLQHAPGRPELLNIGGGLGIPYFPGDKPIALAPIAENLASILDEHTELADTEIVMELGRFLVGEAGVYVCRVIERKESRGEVFLITDGGLHHHLAASGNFGQVLRKNYPVLIGNKVAGREREVVNVVGPLCTPLDLLATKMEMARAEPGDLVVVFASGAYGRSASPIGFLSHPPPAERLV